MSLMQIGLTGLRAAQAGLDTTGHNVSNVNTPGYTRQQTVQTAAVAQFTGSGYVGNGVDVTNIKRVYDSFLAQNLSSATGSSASATALATAASALDSALADSSSNVSASIDTFFASVQSVANSPSDSAARQTMLSTARTLVARFNDLDGQLTSQAANTAQQISDNVASVNAITKQLATLNSQISNNGLQTPNDLLDQRDQLTQQLAQMIGANSLVQSDGTVNVYVASGQPLVTGTQANTLVTVPDDQDASKQQLAITVAGQPQRLQTAQITGGTIGGLLQFRDQVLEPAQNALGRTAIALGSALNAQNALGQDANGNLGGALFTVASPVVVPRPGNSAGSGLSATITNPTQITASDYRLDYDGTNYKVTNLTSNTSQSFSSLPQTVDGFRISLTGPMAAGDRFTISPAKNGARDIAVTTTDPGKIAAAAPVALTTGSGNTGTAQLASLVVNPASPLPTGLQSPVNVVFHVSGSTTTYDLVDATSGTAISSGNAFTNATTITQNGWSLQISGTPANGDSFTVGPNTGGTGDNRNALLLAGVQQASISAVGSAQDSYNGLVGLVGNQTNEAKALQTSEGNVLSQAQDDRDSLSGVNLDEEAVNLQKYQQAYQAAAKSIAVAQAMFQSILDVMAAVTT
jgi:flagellar hook-associated protein 1